MQRLCEFVAARGMDPAAVTEDSALADDLELDSLDLMSLAQEWAQEYEISLDDQEAVFNITTVGQILDFVAEQAQTSSESTR
jgi:acyl carrier protein